MEEELLLAYFNDEKISDDEKAAIIQHRAELIKNVGASKPHFPISYERSWFNGNYSAKQREFINNCFQGEKVIELGPGNKPFAKHLLSSGASEYTGVEPRASPLLEQRLPQTGATLFQDDALSFLLTQPNESALVISLGVFHTEFFTECFDYFRFLGREVFRVTPKGSITYHTLGNESHKNPFFLIHGFKEYAKDIYLKQ